MGIGELSKRTGLAASRIRFYEDHGLMGNVDRRSNGYRVYSEQTVERLSIITAAQSAGFSLCEIQTLLLAPENGGLHEQFFSALKSKLEEIDQMQEALAQSRAKIVFFMDGLKNRPREMSCQENFRTLIAKIAPKLV